VVEKRNPTSRELAMLARSTLARMSPEVELLVQVQQLVHRLLRVAPALVLVSDFVGVDVVLDELGNEQGPLLLGTNAPSHRGVGSLRELRGRR
jgi:hypothetical protein